MAAKKAKKKVAKPFPKTITAIMDPYNGPAIVKRQYLNDGVRAAVYELKTVGTVKITTEVK